MAFNHRKLISVSSTTNTSICESFCDQSVNKNGYCPRTCIDNCYPTCYRSFTSLIPPLNPPATASDVHPNRALKLRLSLIISLSLLAIACFLFSCYTIYKYYKNRRSSRRRMRSPEPPEIEETPDDFLDEDQGPVLDHPIWFIRTIGLQASIIESITVCKYKRGDGLVDGTECSVCLNEFQEDETLRLLPKCNHAFHIPCIDTWLRSHTNCPMCRAGIVSVLPAPTPEQRVNDLVVGEETPAVVSEREREDGDCELRMGRKEEDELGVENGENCPETSKEGEDDDVQPMRRSVSMDSLSASMIRAAIAESGGNSGTQLVKVNESNVGIVRKKVHVNRSLLRLVGGSSIGSSWYLQKGQFFMKRSFSCSGKVVCSMNNRSRRNSLLPS